MPFKQLAVSLICLPFLSSAHAQSGELAMVGEFYAEYVSAESGEVWLGLYQVGDDYELRSTTLVVNERRSTRMRMDFKEVETDQPSEPLFLVKGLAELQPGKVETFIHDRQFIHPGKVLRSYAGTGFSLAAVGEASERHPFEVGISKYKFMLWASKRSQTLLDFFNGLDDATPGVLWAGDLDRDGKVDLFMEMNRHYASISYALFLSSAAKDEEIVGKAATWRAAVD